LRGADAREPLAKVEADLFVVAAFGLIFGPSTLAMPRKGCVNLHASLLPKYRGASPILAAILSGDRETGVTLMRMEQGLDTGGMIASVREPIHHTDTTESLTGRLSARATELTRDSLVQFAEGELVARPQPSSGASVTRLIAKTDGWLDWTRSAAELERQIRAMWPWPRAWTTARGAPLQVHRADVVTGGGAGHEPGTLLGNVVACGADALALQIVQPAGRTPIEGRAFVRGLREPDGLVLGKTGAPAARPPLIVEEEA
jgi:methionyl-tRNA formyltransferase